MKVLTMHVCVPDVYSPEECAAVLHRALANYTWDLVEEKRHPIFAEHEEPKPMPYWG